MKKPRTGTQILIVLAERELARLRKVAEKREQEYQDCINASHKIKEIYQELEEIIKRKEHCTESGLKKLDELHKREKAAKSDLNKNICDLMDKKYNAEREVDSLASELNKLRLRERLQ